MEVSDKTRLSIDSHTGNIEVFLLRIGLVDSSVKVTILPLMNMISVGDPVTIPSIPSYLGIVIASFYYTLHPSIVNGQHFQYVIKTESGGITTLDTIIKFFKGTTLLLDSMESGAVTGKWKVSAGWNYSTLSAFSGLWFLSQSTTGTYSNNRTLTITTLSNLDLTCNTAAYLSFWTRFRSQPGYDKLQVKVSTNGGTKYNTLPGFHTDVENKGTLGGVPSLTGYQNHWVREVY